MMSQPAKELRARDGFMVAGVVIAFGVVLVVTLGTWKWFVRETAPVVLDWPGGPWGFGAASGLMVVLGSLGAMRLSEGSSRETGLQRAARVAGLAVCGGAAFGVVMYLFASLPGKRCPSYREGCEYIPGTGSAFIACLVTTALMGYTVYRVSNLRAEQRQARERERIRKLRKKGKGKTRKLR
jgi:hypothetical protein